MTAFTATPPLASANIQPAIHELVSCIHAPSCTSSSHDGQITGVGATGFFLGERRLLSRFLVAAFGRDPEVVHSKLGADGVFRATAVIRDGSEDTPDPTLLLRRTRRATADGFTEHLALHNVGTRDRSIPLSLRVGTDLASTSSIKAGMHPPSLLSPHSIAAGICFEQTGHRVQITSMPAGSTDVATSALSWLVELHAGATFAVTIEVHGTQPVDGAFRPLPASHHPWTVPALGTSSVALQELVDWSFGDLHRLALGDPLAPEDTFIAAGCPWYFTLFGRDSLWTARLMMPFGTGLAAATLRSLARRQGTRYLAESAEQPGRIPHELRPAELTEGMMSLPPVYYGSVDATPLWITTLAEAWRWGLTDAEVEQLLPALSAAVDWLVDDSDADNDGLCEYIDTAGTGLSNQGWKDSGDSVNWLDGALASAPIALVEVQGYAYEAAINAIELYHHFHLPDVARIERFADRLKSAFHDKFWLDDDIGRHLAIALDGDKRAVDSTTSNPGHVLGTGLLTADQERSVVARLMSELDCGVGLRTMSSRSSRFNPLSYHNGSIWPHDTAICARGMILAGHPDAASTLLLGLLEAVAVFDGRLPELFASIDDFARIIPYPASCRPQAWSAAVGPLTLWASAPLLPGTPGTPPTQLRGINLFGDLDIDGFVLGGTRLTALIRSDGTTYAPVHGA